MPIQSIIETKQESKSTNYAQYLKVNELLQLQNTSGKHDEMLFIIIHQVYELWFKEVMHELDHMNDLLRNGDTSGVLKTAWRIQTIFKILINQFDVLETMTPLEFNTFRDGLGTASGFESYQFRALEFSFGLKSHYDIVIKYFANNDFAHNILLHRYKSPTVWDAFLSFLAYHGYSVPLELIVRDVTQPIESSAEIQNILIDVYRQNSGVRQVCECLVEMDENITKWRFHHVLMVKRTIGAKMGTGGSDGVKYLTSTLSKISFPDLWEVRNKL